jgi:lipopolysaccharide export system protein LptC
MIRPTTWLPLAALSLLVLLTLWLNQLVQAPVARADGSMRHDPDLIVESFNARKLGDDGRVLYTLEARKMVHYPDDDSALLESVKVEAYEPKQPRMMITADNGRLEQGGERILIEGNVVIVRDADAKNDAARITTQKLLGPSRCRDRPHPEPRSHWKAPRATPWPRDSRSTIARAPCGWTACARPTSRCANEP